ncbi:RNA-directed DNA polymerase, eukaryota, reverse transcriptase zinc-binding domain protein [Tanacetum coccineum]
MTSDHSPVVLIIPKMMKKKHKAFRFTNLIVDKPEFLRIVQDNWNIQIEGYFIEWKEKLQEIQRKVDLNPHDADLKNKKAVILKEYNTVRRDKEKLLMQKAKIDWLTDGDRNNKYFNTVLKGRAHRSRIEAVNNENGERFEGDRVADQFVQHFKNFLGKSVAVQSIELESLNCNFVGEDDAKNMVRAVSDVEIKDALYDICDNKAPGPDGYSSKFYKKAWSVVGTEVCEAVKEFFKNGKMLGEVNVTLITLVSKSKTPLKVSDYRPIVCCNVLYKIISKILTNIIKNALGSLVNPSQSVFIPGRQITDNILLTQELLRGYNWKNEARRIALKIDIQKAYDTVNWDFLEQALYMFKFPTKMVNWIMTCIRTIAFTINVNNERCGYFKGGRGLRQWDPISPYIFTLVMEVFTLILQKHIREDGKFRYHWGCKELETSHLYFIDDLLVLCHGDVNSVKVIKRALDLFSSISGLNLNIVGSLPVSYLGVPLITKHINFNDCKSLIDKVKLKVGDWKNRMLSYAGRLQLISSILSSMQVYWASVFILPKSVIKDINKLLKGFLWCHGELSKGKAKVAWKSVCRPKNEGGLGIKDLGQWNEILMAKHLWNIASMKESLWVKWINVIRLKGDSIWEVEWWGPEPLSKSIPNDSILQGGLDLKSKVKDMICNGQWDWPQDWHRTLSHIVSIPVPNITQGSKDVVLWETSVSQCTKFSINKAWKDWRDNGNKVAWFDIIWFSNCTPKHSFTMWMAVQGRLNT